jgi:hypothetical protein
MTIGSEQKLRHDIADSLNPIAVSIGYLEKLIEAGRTPEALALIRDVLQPAMSRARTTLVRNAQESGETTGVIDAPDASDASISES